MIAWYANSSPALSRNFEHSTAALSVIGRRAGGGGRPGTCAAMSSTVTSDISTNSRSNMRFATLGDSDTAGLNGPGLDKRSAVVIPAV